MDEFTPPAPEPIPQPVTRRKRAEVDRSPEADPKPAPEDVPLIDWIQRYLTRENLPPLHLQPFPDLLDRCLTEAMRIMCSVTIRHWKSETVRRFICKAMRQKPTLHIIVMTHTASFARNYGNALRDLCRMMGVRISTGRDTIQDWATDEGGSVFVMTHQQGALGRPCDILIVDDPFANFEEALSLDTRDSVDRIIASYTSRLNRGGSVVIVMSRLHPDDPIGRRERLAEWAANQVQLAASRDEGRATERALCPLIMTLEELRRKRESLKETDPLEIEWLCQFMNRPPEGGYGLFEGTPQIVLNVPDWSTARIVIGIDAAFSVDNPRDNFAAVVLAESGPFVYVVEVIRHARGTTEMVRSLSNLRAKYPDARMASYVSGPEVGVYQLLMQHPHFFNIERMPAKWDKSYRARSTAAAWTAGEIRLVEGPWIKPFVRELTQFTGAPGGRDDQADAFVSGYDALVGGRSARDFGQQFTFGSPVA
jgi:phage terminase large subunit-like protein